MNGKKHRRRAPKITQKVDRAQHRRAMEAKSHIGSKRITLLPGFLINGFTTHTIKKAKGMEAANQKKNNLLHDDLHALLQNGKYPRRSQRILNKNFDQQSALSSKISSIADLDQLANASPILKTNQQKNISFQPILKNTSKSRFKEINEKFARIQLHNAKNAVQKVPPSQTNQNQSFDYLEENSDHINRNPSNHHQSTHLKHTVTPKKHCSILLDLNRSFCKDLDKQICVSFKKNAFKESRDNIVKEIATVNMVLAGKIQLEEMIVQESDETTDDTTPPGPEPKWYPVSPRNWLYRTPPNQKIGVPKLEERKQLQPAVLYQNNHQQNLYEVKAGRSVDFLQVPQVNDVPIDGRFLKKVAQVRKTPAHFGFGMYGGLNGDLNGLWQPWRGPEGGENKETCVTPRLIPRQSTFPNNLGSDISGPLAQKTACKDLNDVQDFTFIQEGDEFKLQESQPAAMQGNKRRSSDEELAMKRRNVTETKMFNFCTQEMNIFDFGKV